MSKEVYNEAESNNRIKKGAIVSYIAIALNILSGLIFTPWMVNQIGQDNYGLYTLALSVINVFTIDFGLSAAVSRFVSKFNAENDQNSINKMLSITYQLYLLIDFVILVGLVVVFFNIDNIYQQLTINELSVFKNLYIMAAVYSLLSFPFITFNGILSAYEYFIELKFADLFQKITSVLLITISLVSGFGVLALVGANAISGILAIFYKFWVIRRNTPISINFKERDSDMLQEIFSFSAWTGIAGIAQRFIFNITPTILGIFSGATSISIFGVASALEGYVFTIANALNGLFLPKVSRILTREESGNKLLDLMIKIGRVQLLIIGIIIIGFISIGKDFIVLWMGTDFIVAYYSAVLLMLPSLISLPQQIASTAVVAMNKVKLQAYVYIIMAATNILLSGILSNYLGVLGASISIFISYILRSIGMNIIYYRDLKINIWSFFKEVHLKMLIPQVVALVLSLLLNLVFPSITWINIGIKGLLIVGIYFVIMFFFVLNNYEKDLIKKVLKRI